MSYGLSHTETTAAVMVLATLNLGFGALIGWGAHDARVKRESLADQALDTPAAEIPPEHRHHARSRKSY